MDKFTQIFPKAPENKKIEVLEVFNKYCQVFEINTPLRVAHFFAQVRAEVGEDIVVVEESTWYENKVLKALFGRYFKNFPEEADKLGYKNKKSFEEYNALPQSDKNRYIKYENKYYTQLAKPDEIAKRIYCCSGDDGYFKLKQGGDQSGIDFKGKGFIQLTWKGNYKKVNDILKIKVPTENVDIVTNPYNILETKIGMLSAMGFWEWQKLNNKADNGATNDIVDSITDIVNYYTNSRKIRKENFQNIKQILGI